MNKNSFTLYSVVLLGLVCLMLTGFMFFVLTNPALASMMETPVPTQEILWASVNVPKPVIAATQMSAPEPVAESPAEAPDPDIIADVTEDGSVVPGDASYEHESDDGRWIDVNLSEQQVYVYEGNALVNSFIVSTGLPDTPTVTGEYRIYVKVPMQDMSGPGYYLPDVPWVMFFYDEYGFHGTYWHNNFGTPMSRGCVNLRTEDADWLYHWASVGTRVSIHY